MSVLSPTVSTPDAVTTAPATQSPVPSLKYLEPRTSLMATMSLLAAAGSAFLVLTGVLAAPGAALGLIAALLALGGITASRQRHIAGGGIAVLALVVGLAALGIGVLATSGDLAWFDTATNNVSRLQHWLDAHASWARPEL